MSDQNGHDQAPVTLAPKADEQSAVITQAQRRGGWVTSIPAKGVWPINDNVQVPNYRWVLIDNRSSTLPLYVGFDAPPINDTQRYDRKVPAGMSRIFNVGPPTQARLFVYNDDGSTAVPARIEVSMEPIVDFQQLPVGSTSSPQSSRIEDGTGTSLASVLTTAAAAASLPAGLLAVEDFPQLYNGTTYDPQLNNTQGTLLSSAARTSTTNSPNQTNYNARGVLIQLHVTAASGTGGLTCLIAAIDPIGGTSLYQLNQSPTAVTATGRFNYLLYPGVSGGAATQATSGILTRGWALSVQHGDASSYTYEVAYTTVL